MLSSSTKVYKRLQNFFTKWSKKKAPPKPPKYTFPSERVKQLIEPMDSPTKDEFIKLISTGGELTQKDEIKVDQGEEEYKMKPSHWEFLAQTIDGYIDSGKNCIYGPFTKEERANNPLLEGDNIMPHFIRETIKEDGTIKLRAVTDASSTIPGGMSFNDNIKKEEKHLAYTAIILQKY